MTDDKPLSVSWSRLKSWMECKQKAYLQSKGMKSPAADTRVFYRGTVTDRVLRQWLQDENREPGGMVSMVDEYMDVCEREYQESGTGIVRWRYAADREETAEWCKLLLTRTEPLMEELVLPYAGSFYADKHFRVPITIPGLFGEPREIQLIGIMDILIDAPGYLAVYDLKATENENYWKKTILQLVFYDLILEADRQRNPDYTALVQPMCQLPIVPLTVTDDHRMGLMGKIVNYAHSVWREEFDPKESDAGCSYCPVRTACVKFKKNESGRMSLFRKESNEQP